MHMHADRDNAVKQPAAAGQTNRTGIPNNMRSRFETISGQSFEDVRVHYNSDKPAQFQALAYTQGNQVHIAPGQERHLPHELGHVVQQMQGRVTPTMSVGGVPVNDSPQLEREADGMFSGMLRFTDVAAPVQKKSAGSVIQRVLTDEDPVLYGYHEMREDYNEHVLQPKDKAKNLIKRFRSIDELNMELGFSWKKLAGKPLGLKRAYIEQKINIPVAQEAGNVHQEYAEKWRTWLLDGNRYKMLRMDYLNAEQCRNDIGFRKADTKVKPAEDKFYNQGRLHGRVRNLFTSGKSVRLTHYEDFTEDDITRRNDVRGAVNINVKQKHNEYVESDDNATVAAAETWLKNPANAPNNLYNRTIRWHGAPTTNKFFRMTSLMGLDFLNHENQRVDFLHDPDFDGNGKRKIKAAAGIPAHDDLNYNPITNSEWAYYKGNTGRFRKINDVGYNIKTHKVQSKAKAAAVVAGANPLAGAGGVAALAYK